MDRLIISINKNNYGIYMELIKKYDEKELTITVKDKIDTTTAPDFENEIMDEIGKFDSLIIDFTDLE